MSTGKAETTEMPSTDAPPESVTEGESVPEPRENPRSKRRSKSRLERLSQKIFLKAVSRRSGQKGKIPLKEPHKRHTSIITNLVTGVVLTAVMVGFGMWFETTPPGQRLKTWGYELLQDQLSRSSDAQDPPVQVVDTSDLPLVPVGRPGGRELVTSRKPVEQLLREIVPYGPRAVGIDIDFSPDEYGNWITLEDYNFFQSCLQLEKEHTPVQIFLGVYRTQTARPDNWLKMREFKSLAASIFVPNEDQDITRIPRSIQKGRYEELKTLYAALGEWIMAP